ncbi:MAG: 2'-5' RNA ligase family protein [Gaiellaceae bacterium]
MDTGERLRLFLALRFPDEALEPIVAWQHAQLAGLRIVPRAHLHVTLAFLGQRPAADVPAIVGALGEAAGAAGEAPRLSPVRYREARSVGMLVLDDAGGRAAALADDVQTRLERLRVYRREARPWLPHLTVARFPAEKGLRLRPPNMGTYVLIPSDASAYLSRLRPGGAQYEILATAALGGL